MNLRDEIARVAWELYEKSGYIAGREMENWLEAERIVMARRASQDIEQPEEEAAGGEGAEEAETAQPARMGAQRETEGATVIEEVDAQAANVEEEIAPAAAKAKPVKKAKRAAKPAPKPAPKGKKGAAGKGSKAPKR